MPNDLELNGITHEALRKVLTDLHTRITTLEYQPLSPEPVDSPWVEEAGVVHPKGPSVVG